MLDTRAKIVVVVPTYNERDSLPVLVEQLAAQRPPNLRLLIVDDNSPDGTAAVTTELAAVHGPWIELLQRSQKAGLGRAYVAGMTHALHDGADVVVQMDGDLSHPVSSVVPLVRTLLDTGAAVAIGSRYVAGGSIDTDWPLSRRLLSRWANAYVERVLHLGVADATAGFKAWDATALRTLDLQTIRSSGYAFQVEMNHRVVGAGGRAVEMPIRFVERASGRSKMTAKVQFESAVMPWRLRRSRGAPAGGKVGRHERLTSA